MKTLFFCIIFIFTCSLMFSQTIDKNTENRGYIVKVGDKAPDFIIKYLNGKETKLSRLQGKVVMLQFTASWCGVCRKEMPFIESEIWQEYKSNPDFVLLGIDYKESLDELKSFIELTKVTYPLILDQTGDIFFKYAQKNAGVTRNIIIDREGKIIFLTRLFDKSEFEQMKQVIKKELNKK